MLLLAEEHQQIGQNIWMQSDLNRNIQYSSLHDDYKKDLIYHHLIETCGI
jgi:hypothetical protein